MYIIKLTEKFLSSFKWFEREFAAWEFGSIRGSGMNSQKITDKLIRQLGQIRTKKVKSLKSKIDSGTYKINSESIARSIVSSK